MGAVVLAGPAVAISLHGHGATEPSVNFRMPGDDRRALRSSLPRSRPHARTRLAACRGGVDGQGARADRLGSAGPAGSVAGVIDRALSHERPDLMGAVRDLPARRLAAFPGDVGGGERVGGLIFDTAFIDHYSAFYSTFLRICAKSHLVYP